MSHKNTTHITNEAERRSEKVQQLLGPIPNTLTTTGYIVIAIIIALLTAVTIIFPNPVADFIQNIRHMIIA